MSILFGITEELIRALVLILSYSIFVIFCLFQVYFHLLRTAKL